jgi:hypothetical protein
MDEHADRPGWRELTPVEFADQMSHVSERCKTRGAHYEPRLEELDRRREAE